MKKIYISPSSQWGNPYAYNGYNEAQVCGMISQRAKIHLERNGYEVESKQSTGKKGIQKETLHAIASAQHYFDRNDIIEKGNQLNTFFIKKMIDEGKTTFEKNDPEIRSILGL